MCPAGPSVEAAEAADESLARQLCKLRAYKDCTLDIQPMVVPLI